MKHPLRNLAVAVLLAGLVSSILCGQDLAASNRALVTRDLLNLAAAAQRHFAMPASRGGGAGAFDNSTGGTAISTMVQLTPCVTTAVGTYSLTAVSANQVVLDGTGTQMGWDGNPISVTLKVFPDSVYIVINN
jgi:hypothetical protein